MERGTIALVSLLEPWSMSGAAGAPSLYETLKGYLGAGWRVVYITSHKRAMQGGSHESDVDPALDGLVVRRFQVPAPFQAFGRLQAKLDRLHYSVKYAARALQGYLAAEQPDLIYAYEEAAVSSVARLRRSCRLPAPVVHRFQGTILGERYTSLAHCLRKYESWSALRREADFYVMTNDGTLGDRALRHWNEHVGPDNLLFIRNGINKQLFHPPLSRAEALVQLGLPEDRLYLLTVSRLAGWKRVDRAIRIVAKIKERFPAVRLLICGDGEARPELERLTASLEVTGHVQFLGSQPQEVIARLLSAADIFLSLYDISNCGNPLFEAMLNGRCIVTLDNGGTGTVITDGSNGRLIPVEREAELPQLVSMLLENPDQRVILARGAREWASRELYTWDERMRIEIDWLEQRLATV